MENVGKVLNNQYKYLGIYIGKNKKENECLIWDEKIQKKIQNILINWKQRILTFYGKVVVIKALIASQIVYTATVVTALNVVIKSLNKSIYASLWSSKREE